MPSWHCLPPYPPFSRGGRKKRKGKFRRRKKLEEGVTPTAHFANSSQPTLPSQWYTYSTSPPALNSLLSLNSASTEKTNIPQNAMRLWLNIDHPCYMNMKFFLAVSRHGFRFLYNNLVDQLATETFGLILSKEINLAWRNVFDVNLKAALLMCQCSFVSPVGWNKPSIPSNKCWDKSYRYLMTSNETEKYQFQRLSPIKKNHYN